LFQCPRFVGVFVFVYVVAAWLWLFSSYDVGPFDPHVYDRYWFSVLDVAAESVVAEALILTRKTTLTATQQAYAISQKTVVDAQTTLTAAQKVQTEAIAARKPLEDAFAKATVALAAAAKVVADSTTGIDQIHQQVVTLQAVK